MPPAAATHQIVGETDRLNQVPHITSSKYIFNGVPDDKGKLKLQELDTFLNGIPRGGSNLLANAKGTDPGVGGTGNPTVQAQHVDRSESGRDGFNQ